jgi:hypothetical protein
VLLPAVAHVRDLPVLAAGAGAGGGGRRHRR